MLWRSISVLSDAPEVLGTIPRERQWFATDYLGDYADSHLELVLVRCLGEWVFEELRRAPGTAIGWK